MLESKRKRFLSTEYLLTDDGRPCGRFKPAFWTEVITVSLLDEYRLKFKRRMGIIRKDFGLIDLQDNTELATAKHEGVFSSNWLLSLSIGACLMEPMGPQREGFEVKHLEETVAEVDESETHSGDWYVKPVADLPLTDQVIIGLTFHTVLKIRRAS